MKIGRLAYNYENDRIGILDNMDLWVNNSEFHCGECLEIFINGEWKKDRIELRGSQWYLYHNKISDLEGLRIRY